MSDREQDRIQQLKQLYHHVDFLVFTLMMMVVWAPFFLAIRLYERWSA